jgi:hypothetical protein
MKDLEDKYTRMLRRMDGEDLGIDGMEHVGR